MKEKVSTHIMAYTKEELEGMSDRRKQINLMTLTEWKMAWDKATNKLRRFEANGV